MNGTFKSIRTSLEADPKKKTKSDDFLTYTFGGKTGTSRNQTYNFGPSGSKTIAQSLSLTSTAMITIRNNITGEKHFGVVMAYVKGPYSAKHHFTSALAMTAWNNYAPVVKRMIETPHLNVTKTFKSQNYTPFTNKPVKPMLTDFSTPPDFGLDNLYSKKPKKHTDMIPG